MPIQKFRRIEDMPRMFEDPNDPDLGKKIARLWEFSTRLVGPLPRHRGVAKFSTIEEANAHQAIWEERCIDYLRSRSQPVDR